MGKVISRIDQPLSCDRHRYPLRTRVIDITNYFRIKSNISTYPLLIPFEAVSGVLQVEHRSILGCH